LEKLKEIRAYLESSLSPGRYKHSLGVESTSILLAERFGLNREDSALAGLSHDICREMNRFELEKLTSRRSDNFVLLHGHAGAELLRNKFKIQNLSVLNAVRFHISGNEGLDDLAKVLFVSDYLEPGRTHISDDERSRLFLLNLDDMVLDIACKIKIHLEKKECTIESELNKMILDLSKE
jgi:predicted HD superfamily hydrolase involved in NAD metabolism